MCLADIVEDEKEEEEEGEELSMPSIAEHGSHDILTAVIQRETGREFIRQYCGTICNWGYLGSKGPISR